MAARDVMMPSPVTVGPLDRCREALRLMREQGIACLPVVHEGRLVGIVSERDFLPLAARWLEAASAADGSD